MYEGGAPKNDKSSYACFFGRYSPPRTSRRTTYVGASWPVAMFRQHYESTTLQDKELTFAEFKVDYEKFGESVASGGLHYMIYFDIQHQHLDDGLDLRLDGDEPLETVWFQLLRHTGDSRFGRRTVRARLQAPVMTLLWTS